MLKAGPQAVAEFGFSFESEGCKPIPSVLEAVPGGDKQISPPDSVNTLTVTVRPGAVCKLAGTSTSISVEVKSVMVTFELPQVTVAGGAPVSGQLFPKLIGTLLSVAFAGWLSLTAPALKAATVVPVGMPGPITETPVKTKLLEGIVSELLPAMVDKVKV